MLKTFEWVAFDFHTAKGCRLRFAEVASTLAKSFDTAPQIVGTPIFTYARCGRSQLGQLRQLDESRPAIVYLSTVVLARLSRLQHLGMITWTTNTRCHMAWTAGGSAMTKWRLPANRRQSHVNFTARPNTLRRVRDPYVGSGHVTLSSNARNGTHAEPSLRQIGQPPRVEPA